VAIKSDGDSPGPQDDPEVAALAAAGRHAEAAARALAVGQPLRAAEIFERIWDFAAAARAASAGGDLPRALRLAAQARDDAQVADLTVRLAATDDGARAALDVLARARRHGEAAALAERLGEIDRAIDLYQRAQRHLDAARLHEAAGRDRDAGRLYERVLDLAAGAEKAEAHLRLGRLLARRADYDEATRHLQEAAREPSVRLEALRHLVSALAALGLRDAARDVLVELRRASPDLDPDLDAYLRAWRDASPAAAAPARDVIAGRYRLGRLLGAGGAGRVFEASDQALGRAVAIKMLHAGRGSVAYERFVREARIAGTLRHPSLVEVYDVSVEQGFLVMEYLPGGSLAQRLAAGDVLGGAQARRLALELAAGLEAAHHKGIVHRDVKPANVFFDQRGAAKLGDFGVAHLIDLGQTQTGGLIGTLAYMAPEQITGAPITIAADLYALGVTLFEALTGRLPFLGPDFVAQHLGEAPPAPSSVKPEVAAGWDAILGRLLRKSPDDRQGSIGELRRELEQLDLGVRAGPRAHLPRRRRDSAPHSIAALAADEPPAERAPRYQFETPLGATAVSSLVRAVDTVLDRSVVIERFGEGPDAEAALAHVRALARAQTPFVQRALSYDRATRTVVFEAPAGAPAELVANAPGPAEAARLLKRLARGAAALHVVGAAHGAISPGHVVIDDARIPTMMVAGLGTVAAGTPAADAAAIADLVAHLVGAPGTGWRGLVAHLVAEPARADAIARTPLPDAEALYAAADALELAVLAATG
jgi:serine/threonine-protein kinase